MADGNYYESYSNMEGGASMMPPIAAYRHPSDPGNGFDVSSGEKSGQGPGFYAENPHYMHPESSSAQTAIESVPVAMAASSGIDYSLAPTATTHLPGMYDTGSSAFPPIKTEGGRHMPPTPPGSPDEPKDMVGYNGSDLSSQSLAKPVPMRRLSEKRIAQARATLTGGIGLPGDPIITPSLGSQTAIAHALSISSQSQRRPRSEKKPIPSDQKDEKYYERRKRNNNAAKKSRDARKNREDEIAIRASFLEKENAILRAQVATLREEANSLRHLLLQKRSRP